MSKMAANRTPARADGAQPDALGADTVPPQKNAVGTENRQPPSLWPERRARPLPFANELGLDARNLYALLKRPAFDIGDFLRVYVEFARHDAAARATLTKRIQDRYARLRSTTFKQSATILANLGGECQCCHANVFGQRVYYVRGFGKLHMDVATCVGVAMGWEAELRPLRWGEWRRVKRERVRP